jgi:hypothetical protein
MITPMASAVARQMRKRTTATERNRARDAINSERFRELTESLKKLMALQALQRWTQNVVTL